MLPVSTYPEKFELLSSWLLRLSNLNGINITTLSYKIFNNKFLLTNDIDKTLSNTDIQKIADYTNINKDYLEKLNLQYFMNSIYNTLLSKSKKWQWIVPSGGIYQSKLHGLQYCPICLQENSKFYIFNKLSWNTICLNHQILLETNCPNCNHSFLPILREFSDNIKNCHNCNFNLSTHINDKEISSEALELQNFLNNCIQENTIINSKYKLLDSNLYELFFTVETLLKFILSIQKNKKKISALKEELKLNDNLFFKNQNNHYFDILISDRRMNLLHIVSVILKTETTIIKDFLTFSKTTYRQFMGSNKTIPKSKTIKKLCENLKILEYKRTKTSTKKVITPKSKDEVDKLMYEIEEYLK